MSNQEWERIQNEVQRMREEDASPVHGSVANLLGINRPVSWLDKNVFPQCNDVWYTHKDTFNALIGNIIAGEGSPEVVMLLQAMGITGIIGTLCQQMYMLGYTKCLDEVQRDRAILDKLGENV